MTKDEALKLALEVMRNQGDVGVDEWIAAEAAIKQALAAPVQEPVLWLVNGVVQASDIPADYTGCLYTTQPAQPAPVQGPIEWTNKMSIDVPDQELYTTPPTAQRQWVGLTDEEIEQGCKESWVTEQAFQSAVWWAEAKLKELNT